jgi:hypothetical protein
LYRPLYWRKIFNLVLWRPLRTRLKTRFYGPYDWSYYPSSIQKYFITFQKNNDFSIDSIQHWDFFRPNINNDKQVAFEINCAGKVMLVKELPYFWSLKLDSAYDIEIYQSTHRFHWAVEKVAQGISSEEIRLVVETIDIWIKQFSVPDDNHIAWYPYNVSERLCNWITILQSTQILTNYPEYKQRFLTEIISNVIYLSEKLEYPASGVINNHILNNGRALYISGKFLGNEIVALIGQEIIKKHFSIMIGEKGFLLEASSHYHFLLTRTAFEISKIAQETNDFPFSDWIENKAQEMLLACHKILPQDLHSLDEMPRIGDVSPDISFSWFSPISDQFNGDWNKLWNVPTKLFNEEFSKIFEGDGWLSIEKKKWSIIAFSHPDRTQYPFGHGHDDYGSFCLYFSGFAILVDKGRLDYIPIDQGGSLGITSQEHNTVIIDSDNALFSGIGVKSLLSAISIGRANYKFTENNKSIIWNIPCQNSAKWIRILKVESDSIITITDKVESCKAARGFLNLRLCVKPNQVSATHIEFLFDEYICEIKQLNKHHLVIESTEFYPQYGEKIQSKRLSWKASTEDGHVESIIQISIKKMDVK